MELGMVGLGKMGGNMTRRLLRHGHRVVVYDRHRDAVDRLAADGAVPAIDLAGLVQHLSPPRAVWVMLPAGEATESAIGQLAESMSADDVIVDGGNTFYRDDLRRAAELGTRGIRYVDQGTSGGVWGLQEGYCLMLGGEATVIDRLRPVFESLAPAPDRGWGRVGPTGAGHFAKMVHNGIEYGMMQALAEGFELLHAKDSFEFDLHQVAEIWRHGSVVRSWLLDLTARALAEDNDLRSISDWVADSGEGRWTLQEAIDLAVPVPVIASSLWTRFRSRQESSFTGRLLAALRDQFGGHGTRPSSGGGR